MKYDFSSTGFYTFDCLGWPFTAVPPGGGCYFIDELTLAVSGAAGTAAIAAAKMGLNTLAVGGVGDDLMGKWVLERLESFGVDASGMQLIKGGKTSSSIVTTREDGSRPALHMKGATGDFYVDDTLLEQVTDAKVVHIGGIGLTETMDRRGRNATLMRLAKSKGAVTTLDVFATSPDDMKAVAEVLPHVDYFLPSIEEARALSNIEDMEEAARFFLDIGVKCCVFTLGSDGAYYRHSDGTRFALPAFDVDVKCTCGCGDAFNAGFAVGLCRNMPAETAVRFAQATSALNATGLGSQAGVQSFEHTWSFMQSTPVKKPAAEYAIAG